MRTVYTIGYGGLSPAALLKLATELDVTVVDVRGRPVSRQAGWGGKQLAALLGERYAWQGDLLGGLYHLDDARAKWPAGVERLMKIKRPMMLCQCRAPQTCHRHMIADVIVEAHKSVDVVHLFADNAVESRELFRAWVDHDKANAYKWKSAADLLALEASEGRW